MNIQRDAMVEASDGFLGRVRHVVVDPDTREVTDLVVDRDGTEWLVPARDVVQADGERIVLRSARAQIEGSATFDRNRYHAVDDEAARDETRRQALHGGAPLLDAGADAVEIGGVQSGELKAVNPGDVQTVGAGDLPYHVELREERLRVEKQPREAGALRISRRIVERTETVEVPVREEHLVIEPRPGHGRVRIGDRELREGESIELLLMREEIIITKEAIVTEDITIRKETVERTERVSGTVRKETLDVQREGDVVLHETGGDGGRAAGFAIGRGGDRDAGWHAAGHATAAGAAQPPPRVSAMVNRDDTSTRQADRDSGREGSQPLSPAAELAGTAVVGQRPLEYTYPPDGAPARQAGDMLAEGLPVVTEDGDALGVVGEVAADRFKVRTPMAPDYWLSRDFIAGIAPGGDLVVAVTRDTLDQAKVDAPERD